MTSWARERGLRSRYGAALVRSAVHSLLCNPIYCGEVPWKGRLFPGKHEPLVSKLLFRRVQDKLHGGAAPRSPREFPYRGFLTCGYCGCQLTAELKKQRYVYYRCTYSKGKCEQPYHPQEKLSRDLLKVIESVHLSTPIVSMLLELLRADSADRARMDKARLIELRSEERLGELRDKAYLDKLEGAVEEDRWLKTDAEFGRRLELVRDDVARIGAERMPSTDGVEKSLRTPGTRTRTSIFARTMQRRARLLQDGGFELHCHRRKDSSCLQKALRRIGRKASLWRLVGRGGFEPPSTGPEPAVLPLNDLPDGIGWYRGAARSSRSAWA